MKRCRGFAMKLSELETMSVDHLWKLRAVISDILAARIAEEKKFIEERLFRLRANSLPEFVNNPERGQYPRVFPKFRNPDDPSQTWAGRGKQPRWLTALLEAGRQVDEF